MLFVVLLGLISLANNLVNVLTDTVIYDSTEGSCNDEENAEKYSLEHSQFKYHPVAKTKFGYVFGQREIFNGKDILHFGGIRYAIPPIGDLRFRKPQRLDGEAIETFGLQNFEKVACIQPKNYFLGDLAVSEDCLHLNIWTPQLNNFRNGQRPKYDLEQLPVMIWIHGGSFHIGSANQDIFNGVVLSAIGEVVVVTINYRLGFFGFLNAELESAPGNMGLYDQAAALMWVKENIEEFGGNPNQVTVFGGSAGGVSVGLLMVSPFTRNLFNRAIIQSGSPYSPLRPEPKVKVFAKSLVFSKVLNCSDPDAAEFDEPAMKCLRKVSYKEIIKYGRQDKLHSQFLPNPMYGDEIVPDNVHVLMKNRKNINPNLEVLIGINKDEGFTFIYQQLRNLFDSDWSRKVSVYELYTLIGTLLKGRPVDPFQIMNFYFPNVTQELAANAVLNTLIDVYGDFYVNCPVYYLADRLKQILGDERIIPYVLKESSSQRFMPICNEWSMVCHGDERVLVFGVPLKKIDFFTSFDKEMSENVVKIWAEFARTGKVYRVRYVNNVFLDIPNDRKKTNACDGFWRELFERQLDI